MAVALVASTIVLAAPDPGGAVVDEGTPVTAVRAAAVPAAVDDCRVGRRRTGTSALRLGVDPAPTCGALLAAAPVVPGRRAPGIPA